MDKTTMEEVAVSKTKTQVLKEAKRIEEALLYSSKGHFAAAHFWNNFHLWIGIPIVVLSAVAGVSALSDFDTKHIIAGVISVITVSLSSVMTFLNPNDKANTHLNAGNCYDSLMNKVRIFLTIDFWEEQSDAVLSERLKYISEQKGKLNESSPQIPKWAYSIAKKGIVSGEGDYSVDQEAKKSV